MGNNMRRSLELSAHSQKHRRRKFDRRFVDEPRHSAVSGTGW
jgi:hypothetical protein